MNESSSEWFERLDDRGKHFAAEMLSPVGMGYRRMDAIDKCSEYSEVIARELGVRRQFDYLFGRYFDAADYVRGQHSEYGGEHIRDASLTGDEVDFTLIVPRRISPLVIYPLSVSGPSDILPEDNAMVVLDELSNISVEFVFERLIAPLPSQEEFESVSNSRWPDMVLWRSTVLERPFTP